MSDRAKAKMPLIPPTRTNRIACRLLDLAMPGAGTVLAASHSIGRYVMAGWVFLQFSLAFLVLSFTLDATRAFVIDITVWLVVQANLWMIVLRRAEPDDPGNGTSLEKPQLRRHELRAAVILILLMYVAVPAGFLFTAGRHFTLVTVSDFGTFPAILPGETLLVLKTVHRSPERGELVAWNQGSGVSIGRIAGVGGDNIETAGSDLRINGISTMVSRPEPVEVDAEELKDPDTRREADGLKFFRETPGHSETISVAFFRDGVITGSSRIDVPEGMYFVLSDNRTTSRSLDSRHTGPIARDRIIGVPIMVVWSPGRFGLPRIERTGAYWK